MDINKYFLNFSEEDIDETDEEMGLEEEDDEDEDDM